MTWRNPRSRARSSCSRTPTTPSSCAAARWRSGPARVRGALRCAPTGPRDRTSRVRPSSGRPGPGEGAARRRGGARCRERDVPRRDRRPPRGDSATRKPAPRGRRLRPEVLMGPRPIEALVGPGLHQSLGPQAGRRAGADGGDARRAHPGDVPGARGRRHRTVRDRTCGSRAPSPTPTSTSPRRSIRRSPRSPSTSPRKARPPRPGCASAPGGRRGGGAEYAEAFKAFRFIDDEE